MLFRMRPLRFAIAVSLCGSFGVFHKGSDSSFACHPITTTYRQHPAMRNTWSQFRGTSATYFPKRHQTSIDGQLRASTLRRVLATTAPQVDGSVLFVAITYMSPIFLFFVWSFLEGRAREAGKRALVAQARVDRLLELPAVDQTELEARERDLEFCVQEYASLKRVQIGPFLVEVVPKFRLVPTEEQQQNTQQQTN